jgi:integrase
MGCSGAGLVANENYRFGKCIVRRNSRAAEAKEKNGRVIIRLPRNWFGKEKTFALGLPSTPINLADGADLAAKINADYRSGTFDRTLAIYRPRNAVMLEEYTASQLWAKYCDYHGHKWKPKTNLYHQQVISRWIDACPQDWRNALAIRTYLMAETTSGVAVRVLDKLHATIEWAIRLDLVTCTKNPYKMMGSELQGKAFAKSGANALSPVEQEALIAAFYQSKYSHYGRFVEFLFLTGCRPSEAIGLMWEQIAPDFSSIEFDRSVVRIHKESIVNHLSKTNRRRSFPCNERLSTMLMGMYDAEELAVPVFSYRGDYLVYDTFSRNPWQGLAFKVLGRKTTPYSARDTFITRQIECGKPPAVVAQWVDNSVGMIEKNYLDMSAINSIKPD